ncbi:unnamed protein product [Mytilus coruscus]|uniref:Uncharacterized protein n=1 Tax=Mytilus coruscus TaxID=42192 RepID=A0A6J8AWK2_MYTCO|nr:unnamed protein product [Mytilus coruscus]
MRKLCSIKYTSSGTTEQVLLPNETFTSKETTVIKSETSNIKWKIYILCITTSFILTGLGHLFRTYRKRHALDFRIINEEVILKPLELTSYIDDIYDEVDDNTSTFVTTGSNVTSKTSNNETINFVFDDRQTNTADNEHDEAGYFDLYFAMKEDVNHQEENRGSQKESRSTNSSISNDVDQNITAYHKPYIQHQEYSQEDPHACEVTVTVHHCMERSSWSDEDGTRNVYSNVCLPFQKDRKMNKQANESHLSSDSNTVHDTTLPLFIPSTFRTCYLQDSTNKYAESEKTLDACSATEENKSIKKEMSKTF